MCQAPHKHQVQHGVIRIVAAGATQIERSHELRQLVVDRFQTFRALVHRGWEIGRQLPVVIDNHGHADPIRNGQHLCAGDLTRPFDPQCA